MIVLFFVISVLAGSPENTPAVKKLSEEFKQEKKIEVLSSNEQGIEFMYRIPESEKREVRSGKREYEDIVKTLNVHSEAGKPALPVEYVTIGVPIGAKVDVQVLSSLENEIKNIEVPPVQGFFSKEKDYSIYGQDAYWPAQIVEIVEQNVYRGQEIVKLKINPLRYNPRRKDLIIDNEIKIRVNFYGGGGSPHRDKLFEDVYKNVLLNYEEARNWRKSPKRERIKTSKGAKWYKIEVPREGIYKIAKNSLDGVTDSRTIKLYNGGSRMVTSDTLIEIPIYELSAGSPDNESIVFYGASLNSYGKNAEMPYLNPFASTNVYWLTYGGNYGSRDSISVSGAGGGQDYFTDTLHIEQDLSCPATSGLGWIWERLERTQGSSKFEKEYKFNARGIHNNSCKIRIAACGWYADGSNDSLSNIWMIHNMRVYLNGSSLLDTTWKKGQTRPLIFERNSSALKEGENVLKVELYKGTSQYNDVIFFDWCEIIYAKEYETYNNELKFRIDGATELQGFGSSPVIFDITNDIQPVRVYGTELNNGVVPFSGNGVYYASASFIEPGIRECNPYRLWTIKKTDEIIITHPDFIAYANSLADWRNTRGVKTEVVNIDDIYDCFSWGIRNSPYGIKNFLSYAYKNWGEPGYCLLFGAGINDYRGNLDKNRIPPYEEGYAIGQYGYPPQSNSVWDYWYTSGNYAIGRTTAKSVDEARDIVEKIKKYEQNNGVWQNRVLLIADDEWGSGTPPEHHGDFAVVPANAADGKIPTEYDVFRVYLMNYSPEGRERGVAARKDLIRYIDDGMFMTFFWGHGNLRQLCHEVLFEPANIEELNNGIKIPFSHFQSCGVGCFDRALEDGMADAFQKAKNKGSIGTLAEARSAGIDPSKDSRLIENILVQKYGRLGEGVFGAILGSGLGNNVNLFADPGTKLPERTITVQIDSIIPDTSLGDPPMPVPLLRGGKVLRAKGKAPGAKFAYITVRSSEYTYLYEYSMGTASYKRRGRMFKNELRNDILFEGIVEVNNGAWGTEFFIPILDAKTDSILCGDNGKVSVFAWNNEKCGTAARTCIISGGKGELIDTVGPKITFYWDNKKLQNWDVVPNKFMLTIEVEDSSGINTFARTMPLFMILTIYRGKSQAEEIPVMDYFEYDIGSCRKGKIKYPLELSAWAKEDTIELHVSDYLGNTSTDSIIVKVEASSSLGVTRLLNYPNPVRGESTDFSFFLSKSARVSIRIYTISGRLIKEIDGGDKSAGFNKIYWDTRDILGNRLGNGIYIYKLTARAEEMTTTEEKSETSKLIILR